MAGLMIRYFILLERDCNDDYYLYYSDSNTYGGCYAHPKVFKTIKTAKKALNLVKDKYPDAKIFKAVQMKEECC